MEAYEITVDIIISSLSNPAHKSLMQTVIKFLDNNDIEAISLQAQKNQVQNQFTQLIRTYYFINNYLNKIDRSFYYSFYGQQHYLNIQGAHIGLIANNYSNCYLQFPKQYRKCLNFISKLFPEQVQPSQLASEIERMITDTDIPMPKLKRQNQGIFCRTSFQNYLIYLKFKSQCFADYQQIFEGLNLYFQDKEQIYLQKLFMKAGKDKTLSKKVRFLRFTPYQITFQNFQSHLIQNNSLHNLLVIIFALTDVWLNSVQCYISSIQDPFHRYIQLVTRYSIYRNYVISIQENLSFVFEQYNQLYEQVLGGDKPTYRFWRPAMSKWLLKFSNFHSECSSIYYYCLTKLRTKAALQFLEFKEQQQPDIYMSIKNKMSLREHEFEVNETLIPFKISNGVEDFFDNDKQLYQTILMQYMEYMVDLSINQETVHWCGHSEQILSQPYASFQKYIMAENTMYLKYVRGLATEIGEIKQLFLRNYYNNELQFLQSIEFKPLTLKKIVQCFNLELSDSPTLAQNFIGIEYNFRPNDETLKYFNQKANIKYQLSQQQMYFYSITPLVTADELLTKSISTTCTEALEEQEQSDCEMEYFSKSSSVSGYDNSHEKLKQFEQNDKRVLIMRQQGSKKQIIQQNTLQMQESLQRKSSFKSPKKKSPELIKLVSIQKQKQKFIQNKKIIQLDTNQSKVMSKKEEKQCLQQKNNQINLMQQVSPQKEIRMK